LRNLLQENSSSDKRNKPDPFVKDPDSSTGEEGEDRQDGDIT